MKNQDNDNNYTFSRNTGAYDQTHDAFPQEFIDSVLEQQTRKLGKSIEDLHIIDMGAGTGRLGKAFLEKGAQVTFVDPDPKMVETLKERFADHPKARIFQGSAEKSNITQDHQADLIVMGDCAHFMDEKQAVPEFKRLLKPEGKVATFGSLWADGHSVTQKLRELLKQEYPERFDDQNRPLHRNDHIYYGYPLVNQNRDKLLINGYSYQRPFTQEKFMTYAKTTPQLSAIDEGEERFKEKIVKPLWQAFGLNEDEPIQTYFEIMSVCGDRRKTKAEVACLEDETQPQKLGTVQQVEHEGVVSSAQRSLGINAFS